ncbi:hypothetical protein V6V47_12720 [Micromonospora sp. CPCC 205539]|uniref:hypothetical protein n=1 Tax=Micromonospora sp. CPCC 205539 TaxID=3122408 RepID=UPI002FF0B154
MLTVALTCPLWWVARWASRVLTSLAVVAALALGAGTSPAVAVAPPAPAAAPLPFTAAPLAGQVVVPTAVTAGPLAASCRPASVSGAGRVAPVVAEGSSPAWSADPQPVPVGGQGAVFAGSAGPLSGCGADPDRLPPADGPASRAPRAPPGR